MLTYIPNQVSISRPHSIQDFAGITQNNQFGDDTFDPIEERVAIKKDYVNNETTYYFTQNNVRVVKFNGSVYNYKYVYHEGQLIAQVNPDGSKYYIHGNHEGSSSVITNQSGAVIENTSYSPYGEVLSGGTKTRYGYESKEYDSVVKDTDFNFRKYRPDLAIFAQPDTLIQNVYDPQLLNRYSFERNNPYKFTDPTGHVADCAVGCPVTGTVIILWTIGGLIVGTGVFSVASYYYNKESNANNANIYDYEYATAGDPISGPIDDIDEQLEELQKLKDLSDANRDDLRTEGEDKSKFDAPYDISFKPLALVPTTSALTQMVNDARRSQLVQSISVSVIKNVYKETKTRVNWYHTNKRGISSQDDPQAFKEAVRQAQERVKKEQSNKK